MRIERGRVAVAVAAALACSMLLGCAPNKYIGDRARDFADCWDVGIGIGTPIPYVRVKATDAMVIGAGYSQNWTAGWRGRYGGPAGVSTEEQWAIPLVRCVEEVYADEKFQLEVETWGPFITKRWYPEGEGRKLSTVFSDHTWVGLSATVGIALRFGLNPMELGDFLFGIVLIDPMADDTWIFAPGP